MSGSDYPCAVPDLVEVEIRRHEHGPCRAGKARAFRTCSEMSGPPGKRERPHIPQCWEQKGEVHRPIWISTQAEGQSQSTSNNMPERSFQPQTDILLLLLEYEEWVERYRQLLLLDGSL